MNKIFKNVCVTGAGSGIGRAIAIAMSNEGYNVTCADINVKQANETLEIILNTNGSGISIETALLQLNENASPQPVIPLSVSILIIQKSIPSCFKKSAEDDFIPIENGTFNS